MYLNKNDKPFLFVPSLLPCIYCKNNTWFSLNYVLIRLLHHRKFYRQHSVLHLSLLGVFPQKMFVLRLLLASLTVDPLDSTSLRPGQGTLRAMEESGSRLTGVPIFSVDQELHGKSVWRLRWTRMLTRLGASWKYLEAHSGLALDGRAKP